MRMSSGVASRPALYSGYISWRNVGPGGSKQTAMCEGFSLRSTSSRVFTKPKIAEVFMPFEVNRGAYFKA